MIEMPASLLKPLAEILDTTPGELMDWGDIMVSEIEHQESLNALAHRGRSQVIFTFPEWKQTDSTTSLVLKSPKTESSVRKVYLPRTVALALREVKSTQDALKLLIGDEYADYGLVIAHEDGRPYEERQIAALLRKLIAENEKRLTRYLAEAVKKAAMPVE